MNSVYPYELRFVFETWGEAQSVLKRLQDVIRMNGKVSVGHIYECMGNPSNDEVNKYYWRDLSEVSIDMMLRCPVIKFPEPEYYRGASYSTIGGAY